MYPTRTFALRNSSLGILCEDPHLLLHCLPPGLLSKGLLAFERFGVSLSQNEPDTIQILEVFATLFDLCRNVFGRELAGDMSIRQRSDRALCLLAYGSVVVQPVYISGHLNHVAVRYLSAVREQGVEVASQWRVLRDLISKRAISRAVHNSEDTPVVRALHSVLYACPYLPGADCAYRHKWRAKLIDMISEPENDNVIHVFSRELWKNPRLLHVEGWCGGNVLHACSRTGNVRLVRTVLEALRRPEFRGRLAGDSRCIVEWRNCDGHTPLEVARLYDREPSLENSSPGARIPFHCIGD